MIRNLINCAPEATLALSLPPELHLTGKGQSQSLLSQIISGACWQAYQSGCAS